MILDRLLRRSYSTGLHFEKFAKNWWDINGDMFILHDYNQVRVPFIAKSYKLSRSGETDLERCNTSIFDINIFKECEDRDKLDKELILSGLNILDVGCGGGILSESLAKYNSRVLGIDVSKELIDVANEHKINYFDKLNNKFGLRDDISNNLRYELKSIDECNEFGYYDIVIASEIIEHIENDKKLEFIKKLCKLVKKDGILIITTLGKTLLSCLINIYIAESLYFIPKGTHLYNLFISEEECTRLLNNESFKLINRQGLLYIPFLRRFIHLNSTDLLYMVAYQNCTGNGVNGT